TPYFFHSEAVPRDLPSFPTRRSSDLMIGKWHLFSDPTGFDYWNILPGQGIYHNPVFIEMGQRKTHQGYVTDLIADLTLMRLALPDRKSTRLNSSHVAISYAVFCLKKK